MNHNKDLKAQFGARLKAARERTEWTLEKVGQQFGYKTPKQTAGHWETGHSVPDALVLRSLCRMFKISADDLLWGNDVKPAAWPFPEIDRQRFDDLLQNQRIEIQGVVRERIERFEAVRPPAAGKPAPALVSNAQDVAPRGATLSAGNVVGLPVAQPTDGGLRKTAEQKRRPATKKREKK